MLGNCSDRTIILNKPWRNTSIVNFYNQTIIFHNSPCDNHWNTVVRIPQCVKESPRKGLVYIDRDHTIIAGYTNVDWEDDTSARRFTLQIIVLLLEEA